MRRADVETRYERKGLIFTIECDLVDRRYKENVKPFKKVGFDCIELDDILEMLNRKPVVNESVVITTQLYDFEKEDILETISTEVFFINHQNMYSQIHNFIIFSLETAGLRGEHMLEDMELEEKAARLIHADYDGTFFNPVEDWTKYEQYAMPKDGMTVYLESRQYYIKNLDYQHAYEAAIGILENNLTIMIIRTKHGLHEIRCTEGFGIITKLYELFTMLEYADQEKVYDDETLDHIMHTDSEHMRNLIKHYITYGVR